MDGSILFAMWRQCAPVCNSNTSLGSPEPFLHSSLQRVPMLYNGPPPGSTPKIAHSSGKSGPDLIDYMVPLAHPSPQPKRHIDPLSRFCMPHDCVRQTASSRL